MLKKLRVHIAPIGFEVDRVVLPLLQLKADRVWLVSEKDKRLDEAKPYLTKIKKQLKMHSIEVQEESCTIRDLFDVLSAYHRIIQKEGIEAGNDIFFNVSTGSKVEAIAGMMASMMFKSQEREMHAYYVEPERYITKPNEEEELTQGCKSISALPDYRIERPKEKLIKALKIVAKEPDGIKKKDWISAAERDKLLTIKENATSPASSKHSALNKGIMEPLLDWGFITTKDKGKRGKVIITEKGKNALRFLDQY